MPPTPLRIAQTSNEAKKQYKQNGPRLSEHQQKQLERGYELDTRAARLREADDRRRAAKKKRDEREEKERAVRKQMGVGLATQLIGYSHTQAQLKNGMEAFLGLKRRKEEEQRTRDAELARKLDEIVRKVEKEPWDDDDADDIALDLPQMTTSFGEQYADDDLDDDTLLEAAHGLVMSDAVVAPALVSPQVAPSVTTPTSLPIPNTTNADFTRLHGPVNKAVESILDRLPEPLVELLSHDLSVKLPAWDPAPGLLHKLNPLGLPPHRLRIKLGSVVSLLRDLNTSTQLSKSQHLRVLRIESGRLECLVLNGHLEGTKAFLTRIAFHARYRNDDAFPFQRTQFPIRIATDYTPSSVPRALPHSGFKVPSLPASKSAPASLMKPMPTLHIKPPPKAPSLDGWDDFLESGTQIARELSSEPAVAPVLPQPIAKTSPLMKDSLPPLSTEDFDFSMDDLEDGVTPTIIKAPAAKARDMLVKAEPLPAPPIATRTVAAPTTTARASLPPLVPNRRPSAEKGSRLPPNPKLLAKKTNPAVTPIDLSNLTPSQKPRSVPNHHPKMFKRKIYAPPTERALPPTKRVCISAPLPATAPRLASRFNDPNSLGISTQEAASFFDDDDDMLFGGSPPTAV